MSRTAKHNPAHKWPAHFDRAGLRQQARKGFRAAALAIRHAVSRGVDPDDVTLPTTAHEVSNLWGWD